MLIIHVHIMSKSGGIERTYDFMRSDGKNTLDGVDVVIPFDVKNTYPISERDAIAIISSKDLRRDH